MQNRPKKIRVRSRVLRRKKKKAMAASAIDKSATPAAILANSQRSSARETRGGAAWAKRKAVVGTSSMWDAIVSESEERFFDCVSRRFAQENARDTPLMTLLHRRRGRGGRWQRGQK